MVRMNLERSAHLQVRFIAPTKRNIRSLSALFLLLDGKAPILPVGFDIRSFSRARRHSFVTAHVGVRVCRTGRESGRLRHRQGLLLLPLSVPDGTSSGRALGDVAEFLLDHRRTTAGLGERRRGVQRQEWEWEWERGSTQPRGLSPVRIERNPMFHTSLLDTVGTRNA